MSHQHKGSCHKLHLDRWRPFGSVHVSAHSPQECPHLCTAPLHTHRTVACTPHRCMHTAPLHAHCAVACMLHRCTHACTVSKSEPVPPADRSRTGRRQMGGMDRCACHHGLSCLSTSHTGSGELLAIHMLDSPQMQTADGQCAFCSAPTTALVLHRSISAAPPTADALWSRH